MPTASDFRDAPHRAAGTSLEADAPQKPGRLHVRYHLGASPDGSKVIGGISSGVHVVDRDGREIDISDLVGKATIVEEAGKVTKLHLEILGFTVAPPLPPMPTPDLGHGSITFDHAA